MDNLKEFCNQRGISDPMQDSFLTYIKSSYSTSYAIKPGDTLNGMIKNMTHEKIEEMWVLFLSEFKAILWSE